MFESKIDTSPLVSLGQKIRSCRSPESREWGPPSALRREGTRCRREVVTGLALLYARAAWHPWEKHQSRTRVPSLQSTPKAGGLCRCPFSPPGQAVPQGIRSTLGCQEQGWARGGCGCQHSVELSVWEKTSDCTRGRWKKGVGKTAELSGRQRTRCRDPRLHKRACMGGEMGRQRADLKF